MVNLLVLLLCLNLFKLNDWFLLEELGFNNILLLVL